VADRAARLTAVVSGQVQGVGFRYWVQREAESLGLVGSATNLPDGRVEVIAEGPRSACETLLSSLDSAATPGYVRDVAVSWSEPRGDTRRFLVR
jgi:acylphosphatase